LNATLSHIGGERIDNRNQLPVRKPSAAVPNRETVGGSLCMTSCERVNRIVLPIPLAIIVGQLIGTEESQYRVCHLRYGRLPCPERSGQLILSESMLSNQFALPAAQTEYASDARKATRFPISVHDQQTAHMPKNCYISMTSLLHCVHN